MNILTVKNISWAREGVKILENLNFSITRQSIVGFTGPNGAGKSSLFEILMGWHRLKEGSVEWTDSSQLAILPQIPPRPRSLPLSVQDFVEMGTWSVHKNSKAPLSVQEAIQELGLKNSENQLIGELSGGEWKRVCLARTLVQAADVFLLDEPFNYLDLTSEERVGHLLQNLAREKSKTFLVVSHDWHAMNHFFDRVILMNRKILADGTPKEVGTLHSNFMDPRHHEWMHPQ